jgi:hypothetical protein
VITARRLGSGPGEAGPALLMAATTVSGANVAGLIKLG